MKKRKASEFMEDLKIYLLFPYVITNVNLLKYKDIYKTGQFEEYV